VIHKDSIGWGLSGTNNSVNETCNHSISVGKNVIFRELEVVKWRRSHSVVLEFTGRKWQLRQV